jgi:hypothetical protein
MHRPRTSVLNGLAGVSLAALVALPLVAGNGTLPWVDGQEVASVEPMRPTAADTANEGVAGARGDAVVAAVQAQREEEARIAAEEEARRAAEAQAAAEKAAAEKAAAEKAAAEKAAAEKAAAEKAAAERAASSDRASRSARTGDPKSIARSMLAARGQADQFGCLDRLWQKESGWSHTATNASSGAYGIPQSLPAGKMASAGADWRTNPATQISWGLGYISQRYGGPCAAWSHSQSRNWY